LLHIYSPVFAARLLRTITSATTGDFNATASLIDVFVTLQGILSGSNAALASSFAKRPTSTPSAQQRSRTSAATARKDADSFLSSRHARDAVLR
jgi:hypothetical protein